MIHKFFSDAVRHPSFSAALFALAILSLTPGAADAQLGGENLRGDQGMKSGSQGVPGFYVGNMFYFYQTGTVKDLSGNTLSKVNAKVNVFANVIPVIYVSNHKILGANYGAMAALPIMNSELALPSLNLGTQTWGLADMYISPLQLGWHFKQADAIASYAFFAPIGRFKVGAADNTGLGMWSNEFSAGTTVYLDKSRKFHAAGTGYYEVHSSKRDQDLKVGDIFTLEGGAGMDMMKGYANAGLAYVGQWKVTQDGGTAVSPLVQGKKGSLFSLGPELNMPVSKRGIFLNFKYLFDTRSRLATSGNYLVLGLTYVKPSQSPSKP